MLNKTKKIILALILFIFSQAGTKNVLVTQGQTLNSVEFATAYELIEAVNTYRSQHGLPAYRINSILMGTAQSQAEYMASIGTVTHTGPGGISFPDRLIAAGYSFVFRSENIISSSPDASGWSLVTSSAWADDLHQHTMLSPDLEEIGAGVSVNGGRGYYVIDTGGSGGGGASPIYTSVPGSVTNPGGANPATPVVVIPNTPKPDGSISHLVQAGETLWSIAIAYKTTIVELKGINRLTSDDIYPGETMIIALPKATSTPEPTSTGTSYPSSTPFMFSTVTSSPQPEASPIPSAPMAGGNGAIVTGLIIAIALVASGVFTAFSARKKS